MAAIPSISALRESYLAETARIRQSFESAGDGMAAIRSRSDLVDNILRQTSEALLAASPGKVALVALGGYGRRSLFPFSDIDLMFLCANDGAKAGARDGIRRMSQDLWDLRLS
jgi:[protein-PII] uridylyltransferase